MDEANSSINPWVRAEQELFSLETMELMRPADREEYIQTMKQLAHAKGIAALALEQVYQAETVRAEFFKRVTG